MIPSHSSLLLFMSAALVLLAILGPAVLYVTSRSIGLGRSAGLVSALGIGVGTLVHVVAAAVGLSALLMSSAAAFSAVKYLGAAYLIYLGVQKLPRRDTSRLDRKSTRLNSSHRTISYAVFCLKKKSTIDPISTTIGLKCRFAL